jgi:hypothetical protein
MTIETEGTHTAFESCELDELIEKSISKEADASCVAFKSFFYVNYKLYN